ncbi:MAG: metallophosphoesterase family protein [Nibricoccus sp.]
MRIAVIADTHNRYPKKLLYHLAAADEIWHLGDVCLPSVLTDLEQLRRPIRVVLGNNDSEDWPLHLNLRRNGVRFYLTHIPPLHPPDNCDVIVHGHTHVPRDEVVGGVRWLNPGCISRPNRGVGPSFGFLQFLEEPGAYTWELMPL